MTDMLVRLYDLPPDDGSISRLAAEGVSIKRPLAMDAGTVEEFVAGAFPQTPGWRHECRATLMRQPPSCFVAESAGGLLGFACFDAAARGMFGPTGVIEAHRGRGIGRALLLSCLRSMSAEGYAYAVIGWVSSQDYYRRSVAAVPIEGSEPGLYRRALGR